MTQSISSAMLIEERKAQNKEGRKKKGNCGQREVGCFPAHQLLTVTPSLFFFSFFLSSELASVIGLYISTLLAVRHPSSRQPEESRNLDVPRKGTTEERPA